MIPDCPLPLPQSYKDHETYTSDLLTFVTTSKLHKALCSEVHILDFFTEERTKYHELFLDEWREWFDIYATRDLVDFFLREDLSLWKDAPSTAWRGGRPPPSSLIDYLLQIRKLSLQRDVRPCSWSSKATPIPRHVATGMGPKKVHEVARFAAFVHELETYVDSGSDSSPISHLVDFGAGQNYLGRTLASPPYNSNVIAVERKGHNVSSARKKDITAKVAPKQGVLRNKKAYRAGTAVERDASSTPMASPDPVLVHGLELMENVENSAKPPASAYRPARCGGNIIHVEKDLINGDLSNLVADPTIATTDQLSTSQTRFHQYLVMSIHSCGDLSHHGLRALVLNHNVRAVAIVGCCYNLLTEKLTAPSYKYANLRWSSTGSEPFVKQVPESRQPFTEDDANRSRLSSDPQPEMLGNQNGFPMSRRLSEYPCEGSQGLNLNINARMMAVQAPANWKETEWDSFFQRHFYRALLQRVFLDKGVIRMASDTLSSKNGYCVSDSPARASESIARPIIIGKLGKSCYTDFVSYARQALERLYTIDERRTLFKEKVGVMTDEEFRSYETRFAHGRKQIGIVWTLMAYSAGLLEAVIVVDRWLWLTEQESVRHAWVEPVFEYQESPRNLVVVGIK